MTESFRGSHFTRDGLPLALTRAALLRPQSLSWDRFLDEPIPARGGIIASWGRTSSDPLAEVLIVRDEEFADTISFLNSFFAHLSPITQWCRVLTLSQARRIGQRSAPVNLGLMLSAWVGAVLAECSAQGGGLQNLRDLPGSAALSTATFAAGRSAAIWGIDCDHYEVARRHDELTHAFRDNNRLIPAKILAPLWSILGGTTNGLDLDVTSANKIHSIFVHIMETGEYEEASDNSARLAKMARDYFGIAEIAECAIGPQVERVRALDRLSGKLANEPSSALNDALLGLGASLVDPGAGILSELLRRHSRAFPTAPIWLGAFAGALAPINAFTAQNGLGRLVAKELLSQHDLEARPSCDIAYEELIRWITPGRSIRMDIRGLHIRSLLVEVLLGVTCTFAIGRTEGSTSNPIKSTAGRNSTERFASDRSRTPKALQDLERVTDALQMRIEHLEALITNRQGDLDLPRNKESQSRKTTRSLYTKR